MVSQHQLFNMFAKFSGHSTVNSFAKANGNVCVNLIVGKKLDVVATDESAFFNQTLFMPKRVNKSYQNFLLLAESNP